MPEQDILGEDWQNKFIPQVTGGIDLDDIPDIIDDGKFLQLDNMLYYKGELKKDTGYADFADVVLGTPRKVIQHITAAGTANTFLITNTSLYRLNGAGTGWLVVQLAGGGDTTLSANASGGATSITVTAITNFADGDVIGIRLDDGTDHVTTINGAPAGSTINFDDAIPGSGVVATSGNDVTEGLTLSGSNDVFVDAVTVPWSDQLVFTNGVDDPQYYDPTSTEVQEVPNLPASGNLQCTALAVWDASLILIGTIEGGTNYNQRIRWCDKGDLTEWTTGDASYIDLLDSTDKVLRGLTLGPHIIIYRDNSITRGAILNNAIQRFQWDTMVTAQGAMSSGSIVDMGDAHFVVGKDRVYTYRGGFDIDSQVGQDIEPLLFGDDAETDEAETHRMFCVYITDRKDIWIIYQTTSGTGPNKAIRLSTRYGAYTTRDFTEEFWGHGESVDANSFTWNDLVGSWEVQTWKWNSTSIVGQSKTVLLCRNDGQVVEYDFITANDDGTAKTWTIETPDLVHPNAEIRHDYIEMKCCGGEATIEYSVDGGQNYSTLETFTPGTDPVKVRLFNQFVGESVRYRLTGTSSFCLYWYNIRYTVETEY
jgi:hypothetical protein